MSRYQQKAFSLGELLITTVLVAILISIAVPAFTRLIEKNRDETLRHLLVSHIQSGRIQAINTSQPHRLCGSSDGKTCNGDWNSHWLLMGANNQPIQQHQVTSSRKLCRSGFQEQIVFHPNGLTPTSNGRFALCIGEQAVWQLVMNRQGRLRIAAENEAACCASASA